MNDRRQAFRYLEQSRRLREQELRNVRDRGGDREYSYVRAFQRDEQTVDFTIVGVVNDEVISSVLVSAEIAELEHPRNDVATLTDAGRPGLHLRWVETGVALGRHPGAAPAKTVEELYAICEQQVLGSRPDLRAQMYFHPDGVLMQCGFAQSQCPDCPRVSIQSYGLMSISKVPSQVLKDPRRWLCRDITGAFPPYSFAATRIWEHCQPIQWACLSDVKFTTLRAPCEREIAEMVERGKKEGIRYLEEVCLVAPGACP